MFGNLRDRLRTSLALALLGIGMMSAPASAVTGRLQIDVGGQKRSAILVEPERLKRAPRTTIIVLHGSNNGSGRRIQANLGLDETVRGIGAVVVYPDAVEGHWNVKGEGGPDDAAFLRTLATKLVSDGIADRRRIFLIGASTGGMLALRVACQGADYAAGVAVLIAALPASLASSCKPQPMAFALVNGTANPVVPFGGGPARIADFKDDVVSAEATLAPFLQANGCSTQRVSHEFPDRDPGDGSRVIAEHFSGCKRYVEIIRVEGGGHTLPGRPARGDRGQAVGAQNRDVNITRLLADFIRRAER